MTAAAVTASGVARRFRGGRGVGPVDLCVERGENLALMGPNGAGKTTLLRLLATIDSPQAGELRWDGRACRRAARRGLGVALDSISEEESLSGRQAAHFWCRQWVGSGVRARTLVDGALGRFGLGAVADEPVAAYSFGMRRRLGLVEALAHEPALALLDEPTAGLDPDGVDTLREELLRRAAAGLATVVASNDPGFVEAACGRVAFLDAGRILEVGAPVAVRDGSAAARVAELGVIGTVDIVALGAVGGVEAVITVNGGVHVRFRGDDVLPRLVAVLDTPPGRLATLRVRDADLRDRFRTLTGRALETDG